MSEEMTEVLSAEAYTANLTIKDVKNSVHSQLVQKQQQWKKSSVVQETMIGKTIFLVKPRWAISPDEPQLTTPKSRVHSCVYIGIYQTVGVQSD